MEFQDLMERWQETEQLSDYRAGVLAAASLEPYRDRERHPDAFQPRDFFPNLPEPKPQEQDPEYNKAVLDAFFRNIDNLKKSGRLKVLPKKRA